MNNYKTGFFYVLLLLTLALSLLLFQSAVQAKYIGCEAPCEECLKCKDKAKAPNHLIPCLPSGSSISITEGNLLEPYSCTSLNSSTGVTIAFSLAYNSYNADNSRAQIDTVMGYGWTHSYNIFLFRQRGHMFRMGADGRVTKYKRGAGGTFTADTGYFETLVRNSNGSFTLRQKDGTTFNFAWIPNTPFLVAGPVYRLTSIVDRNGNTTALTYDANGDLTEIEDTYGRKLTLDYYANHKLKTITDPLSRKTTLEYNSTGKRLIKITDPEGQETQYSYNFQDQITQKVDRDGRTFSYLYNTHWKPVAIKDGDGKTLFSLTNPNNWATDRMALARYQCRKYVPSTCSKTDGRGNVWKYDYDENGYITKVTAPDGAETSYITKVTAPDGAETRYEYDPVTLNVERVIDDNLHETHYEYDVMGNLTKLTDHLGHETVFEYEPVFNNVTKITYPNDSVTEYTYDANGNRTKETRDKGGLDLISEWTYDYDGTPTDYDYDHPRGNVIRVKDPNDHITKYKYDAYGNIKEETDPGSPLPNITQYVYDIIGNRTKLIDGNGHETIYEEYDDLDRLKKETDPLGFLTEYSYDGEGNQAEVRRQVNGTPPSQLTMYEYDLRSRLFRETRDTGGLNLETTHEYDNNDNRTATIDPRGKPTHFDYDVQNRLTLVTDALSNTTETRYDGVGNRTCAIDANGHYTFYDYDALDRLVKESRKIGVQECNTGDFNDIITEYEYDVGSSGCPTCGGPTPGSSNISKVTDPEGKVTFFKYDKVDRRTKTIRKVGDTADTIDGDDWVETVEYDAADNVLSRTDANGNTNGFVYYDNDWLKTEAVDPGGLNETTSYTYDGVGNVATVIIPGGNITTNIYNDRNELTQATDSIGLAASYTYDGVGNVITETDGNGNGPTYSYDAVNRLILVEDAMNETTSYKYDDAGNLTGITDREGHKTCYQYDGINRRTKVIQKMGASPCSLTAFNDIVTATDYDNVGNVIRLTDAKGNSTDYAYDEVNRLDCETYADGTTRCFEYNKAGNLTKRTDQLGQVTNYVYNDLYYLMKRDYQEVAEPDDTFDYDTGGRMTSADRNGWLVTFDAYDGANRLLQTTQNGQVIAYTYDTPARTRTVTYPGGRVITEKMDLRLRLDTIDDAASPPPIVDYVYDLGNRVLTRTYRNGVVAAYSNNDNNWITQLDHMDGITRIAGFSHDYDKEGNKKYEHWLHKKNSSGKDLGESYGYDDIYRLIDYKVGEFDLVDSTVKDPVFQRGYDLDKVGNWDQFTVDDDGAGLGVPVDYNNTPNQMNEYDDLSTNGAGEIPDDDGIPDDFMDDKATPAADGENFAHDKNGNRREDGKRIYEYDDENRLIQVTRKSDMVVTEYRYDALGRRVVKTVDVGGAVTVTHYDYEGARVIEEDDDNSVTLATYVYGNYIDEVLTMQRGGNDYYYHQSTLWSVAAVTNAAANVVERYAYTDYGCVSVTDGVGNPVVENDYAGFKTTHSAIGNIYMFTGRRWDEESGVYYYRARYYDCEGGRFLQRDPLGYFDSTNLYEYVGSMPLRHTDPTGQAIWGFVFRSLIRGGISLVTTIAGVEATESSVVGGAFEDTAWGEIKGIKTLIGASAAFVKSGMGKGDRWSRKNNTPCKGPGNYKTSAWHRRSVGVWAYSKIKWKIEWSSPNGCDIQSVKLIVNWSKNTERSWRAYSLVAIIQGVNINVWESKPPRSRCWLADEQKCCKPRCVNVQIPTALLGRNAFPVPDTIFYKYPSFTVCADGWGKSKFD